MSRKIEGIVISENNIQIKDGYTYSKYDFWTVLLPLREWYPYNNVLTHRSDRSLMAEWSVHNFLYNIGLFRSRTKDVDLNYPIPLYESVLYLIVGSIVWMFIK